MYRKIFATLVLCLSFLAFCASESHAQTATLDHYYAYVAGETITNAGKISYLVMDCALTTSTGPARDIYISYYNDATDELMTTSEDHLSEVTVLSDRVAYAGTINYKHKWCPFRLEIVPSADSSCGYAARLTVWDRKGAVVIDRTDQLNSYSRIVFNP